MAIIDITAVELDHLDKFRKLDDSKKEKIDQIIETYLKCKDMAE